MTLFPLKTVALQELHTRAWKSVQDFMQENCSIFAVSKPTEAESTVMPNCRSWLKERAMEVGTSCDDHTVAIFMNTPAVGVLSAIRMSFTLSLITNVLSDFPVNGVAFVIFPNRAAQDARCLCFQTVFKQLPYEIPYDPI